MKKDKQEQTAEAEAEIVVHAGLSAKEAAKLALFVECPKCKADKDEPCKLANKQSHFLRLKAAATRVIKRALK